MYKDIHSETIILGSIGPVTLTADNTPAAIDLKDYRAAEILVGVGVQGTTFGETNHLVLELSHSDDDASYSAVTDGDILGALAPIVEGTTDYGVLKTLDEAHAAATAHRWGYVGGKRFLKFLFNFVGTHSPGTPVDLKVVGARPVMSPTVDQG